MLKKLKKFWARKILRNIYDYDELFDGTIKFNNMNSSEKNYYLDFLHMDLVELKEDIDNIIPYIAKIPTTCDKCSNYYNPGLEACPKCENTGVIKTEQLCDWHW